VNGSRAIASARVSQLIALGALLRIADGVALIAFQ
jgi:hypothetical protein